MSLKFLKIPAAIQLFPNASEGLGLVYDFKAGIEWIVDNAPEFQKPQSRVRVGARIVDSVTSLKCGDLWEVRADDWQVLTDAIETGTTGWGRWETRATKNGVLESIPLTIPPRRFLPWANAVSEAANTNADTDTDIRAGAATKEVQK